MIRQKKTYITTWYSGIYQSLKAGLISHMQPKIKLKKETQNKDRLAWRPYRALTHEARQLYTVVET